MSFGILKLWLEGKKFNKKNGRKREPHKIYNLSNLSSFFSHKIFFYPDKILNEPSSGIPLLSIALMIEKFSKAIDHLIISLEFCNFSYRLISHRACFGFIFDNLVSISIRWTFSPICYLSCVPLLELRFQILFCKCFNIEVERFQNMGKFLWCWCIHNIVPVKVFRILVCCFCFENIINEKIFLIFGEP